MYASGVPYSILIDHSEEMWSMLSNEAGAFKSLIFLWFMEASSMTDNHRTMTFAEARHYPLKLHCANSVPQKI
jgi:hypothetical protein